MITVPGNLLAALRDSAYNTLYGPCESICLLVGKANREERWNEFDKAFSELVQTRRLLTIFGRNASEAPVNGARFKPEQHRVVLLAAIDDAAKCADNAREHPCPKAKADARELLHALVDFAWTLDNLEAGRPGSILSVRSYHLCAGKLIVELEGLRDD